MTSENLELFEDLKACGAELVVVPIRKAYISIRKMWRVLRYVMQKDIRVINAFDLKSLIIALYIKILFRSNLKVIYHNVNSLIEFSGYKLPLFSFFLKYCDLSISNSKASMGEIASLMSKRKARVIYNGVDTTFFTKRLDIRHIARRNLNLKENEIVLGIVANFRKQKNYPFLMLAFEKLSIRYQGLKLLCVGGGTYFEDTKTWVARKDMKNRVIFTGYAANVTYYLNAIDILVLPSLWEGLPNAILQAMSVGVPVVASNVGGCPEIIRDLYNGILFPPNDEENFVESVGMLIEDSELRTEFAANARKTVEEKFSLQRMIEEYVVLYNSLKEK